MSNDAKAGAPAQSGQAANQADDPIKNVKAEMDRKLGNVDQKLSAIEQTNQLLLKQLQGMNAPKQPKKTETKKLEDVWFEDPAQAAAEIETRTEERIMSKIAARDAQVQKQSQTINQLVSEFPELSNTNHELTKKAVEIYNSYSDEDKTSPVAYKAAVKEAAMELGVKPKSKRTDEENDDSETFSINGSGSNQVRSQNRRSRDNALAPEAVEVARLLGIDIDDPKVKERVKNRANRKFNRWE